MSALCEFYAKYSARQYISDELIREARRDLNEICAHYRAGASPAYILDLLGVSLSDIAEQQLREHVEVFDRLEFFRNMSDS